MLAILPSCLIKGAEVKDVVPALLHVWQEHRTPSVRHHMLVHAMPQNQCEVQDILAHHKGKMVLPTADAILLAQHVDKVLVN